MQSLYYWTLTGAGQDNKVPCGEYCGGYFFQSDWRIVHSLLPRDGITRFLSIRLVI